MQFTPRLAHLACAASLLCVSAAQAQPAVQPGQLPPAQFEAPATTPDVADFPLATPVAAVEAPAEPLNLNGKFHYYLRSIDSPETLGRLAITTAFSHMQNSGGWGSGMEGMAHRMAGRYAEQVTRKSIQFAIGAARGEDPRFYRSGKEGFWNRTKFVLSRTVVTQMDNGSTSLAVGRLTGVVAGNVLATRWHPRNPSWASGFQDAGVNIGGDIGIRMVREFWPDIKRLFKR